MVPNITKSRPKSSSNPTLNKGSIEGKSPKTAFSLKRTEGSLEEKGPFPGIGTKKKAYKYPIIKLYLDEDREKLLKECCKCAGIDPSRVDSHQQDAVWDVLQWAVPLFRMRESLKELFGPILNETPEREARRQ